MPPSQPLASGQQGRFRRVCSRKNAGVCMPRYAEVEADVALRAALADEGLHISRYQLERWRRIGLLPRARVVRDGFGGSRVEFHGDEVQEARGLPGA